MALIRNLTIKIFKVGNKQFQTVRYQAKPNQQFSTKGIDQVLTHIADRLEFAAPDEYRVVQTGPKQFNFVHDPARITPVEAGA